ncbi:MAG: tRNA uridine-5-carboxymethylaminomethyl(34) synthesis GTPase MnmE [Blautia sp.]|nr:tRNA uridine-5-carboxymethylaminomethyl(34) synthesis GTPase MnmE [Blautia sp.]MCM1199841.1 tRNA uridine-5-carboxymethylaminomethyl(34) synthesis GTPase MnmE [Bacteroides fragilis]
MRTDTIAAIATAMTNSGIGIVRISGKDAVAIAHSVFVNKKNQKCLDTYRSHTIHYGYIIEKDGTPVDEVMVSIMKAPHSYTMEDVVEINCHGGVFILQKIMNIVIAAGARTAQPGEFTKRAFLNGRIDLSEAEAVMDIISSKNEFALQSSMKQLKGSVSEAIENLRKEILYEIAFIESALDDPEHISLADYPERLFEKTEEISGRIKKLLDSSDDGRLLKEGINTVIVGKPNVGKSSLLNILVGEEKAIVTEIAGTTRDILEETISLDGITLNIIDTAGIRNTNDVVEKIGVERAKNVIEEADLIVYVIDASLPMDENDFDIIHRISDKKGIALLNKSDLNVCITEEKLKDVFSGTSFLKEGRFIKTSMTKKEGISFFIKTVKEMFLHGDLSYNDEIYITNMRHKEALRDAYESMLQVRKSIENSMPEDFYSIDLMSACASLGTITGAEIREDLVNEIFSEFCMGK